MAAAPKTVFGVKRNVINSPCGVILTLPPRTTTGRRLSMLLTLRTTYLVEATTWRAGSVPKCASTRKSTTIDFLPPRPSRQRSRRGCDDAHDRSQRGEQCCVMLEHS